MNEDETDRDSRAETVPAAAMLAFAEARLKETRSAEQKDYWRKRIAELRG